jgi:hypothetical protein
VGGYIAVAGLSWRWLFWVLTIFVCTCITYFVHILIGLQSGLCLALIIFTIPETYGPVILVKKAKALRASSGDNRYKAPLELQEVSWGKTIGRILGRPWKIFFVEAMLVIMTLYMSVRPSFILQNSNNS